MVLDAQAAAVAAEAVAKRRDVVVADGAHAARSAAALVADVGGGAA